MSAPKQRRWVCPTCASGVLAPSQPRRNDVRRFCLDCSARTGFLVERTCPANERKAAAGRAASTAKAKSKRQTATRRRQTAAAAEKQRTDERFRMTHPITGEIVDARREVVKVWRAARKIEPSLREKPPELVVSRGSGSYAYIRSGEIHLGSGACWSTLVHEVAHFVDFRGVRRYRPDGKRAIHDRDFYMHMRALIEKLVPGLHISFYQVSGWGYEVDSIIRAQLRAEHQRRKGEAA